MKLKIDISDFPSKEIRLYQNVEYTLTSDTPIIVSTSKDHYTYYPKCLGNGGTEVIVSVDPTNLSDSVWIFVKSSVIPVKFLYSEGFMSNHHEDVTPPFINEEYPLFKTMMNYYFRYMETEFNPTDFFYNMEKYAHVDETFDEFRNYMLREVMAEFPAEMAASKKILSKYILQFYNLRGTERSISFLLYVIFGIDSTIQKGRDTLLIASDARQGVLSKADNVLQDNYMHQLYSYVINIQDVRFSQFKDIVYKLVNPSGYLPFGKSEVSSSTTSFSGGDITS
jgi:hypothetical protein